MQNRIGKPWYAIVAALFVAGLILAPSAVAQTVNMQLIGAGPANLGGVYVGPYTALVNGVSTQVICDDFVHDTYFNETWKAVQSNFSNLSGAKLQLYEQGAWLVLQMSQPANAGSLGAIQYALWELFDPAATDPFSYLAGNDLDAAKSWLGLARDQGTAANPFTANDLAQFANFVVYTPVSGSASCGGVDCPKAPPQEFLSLKTPEPAALLVLLLDLMALSGVVLFVRRRVAEV
jgi:hypothetical protein